MEFPRRPDTFARLLTLTEARTEYGFSPRAIYTAVARGKLHAVKPNGRTLYPEWELAELRTGLGDLSAAIAA